MNKYRPGGRCGGEASRSEPNPEFDSSLNRLLQQREQLDAMMKPIESLPAKPETVRTLPIQLSPSPSNFAYSQTKDIAYLPTKDITVVQKKTYGKDQDIELLLQGDYE